MGLQACPTYSLAGQKPDTQAYMILGSLGIYAAHRYAPFGPFAYDKISQEAVRKEQPFEVAACWNGAVVIDAKPLLFPDNSTITSPSNVAARGWKSVDDGPSVSSPLTNS